MSGKSTKVAFALVFLSFLLSTVVSLTSLHAMNQNSQQSMNKVLAMRAHDRIMGILSEPIAVARTMAHDSHLVGLLTQEDGADEQAMEEATGSYLANLRDGMGYESCFLVSDASGRYYTAEGVTKVIDPAHDDYDAWYSAFAKSDSPYDLDVDVDENQQDAWTVFVNARLKDGDGTLLGVCGVGVRMTGIQELLRGLEWDYGVRVRLVDATGLVQVGTDEASIEQEHMEAFDALGDTDGEYVYRDAGNGGFMVTKYVENLGWYLVVSSEGVNEAGQFANVIVLNLVLCVLVMVSLTVFSHVNRRRTNELTDASLKDQATSLHNRRAFEEDKATLMEMPLPDDFVYVTVDVNSLKTANDTLGHAAGDELIQGAAACMEAAFGPYGKTYRIGGDEFAAMLHVDQQELGAVQEVFRRRVAAWSGNKVAALSVSVGYATQKEFPSENLAELSRIADERMYEDKAAYYERMDLRPRRT